MKQKRIYSGKLIQLSLKRKRLPGGYVADLEVVRHPGAVLIVPLLRKGRVILIRQYRPVIDAYIWELPAGTLGKDESPLNCARKNV